jgi:hypothetical protein
VAQKRSAINNGRATCEAWRELKFVDLWILRDNDTSQIRTLIHFISLDFVLFLRQCLVLSLKLPLNLKFSCLHLSNAGIAGVGLHGGSTMPGDNLIFENSF